MWKNDQDTNDSNEPILLLDPKKNHNNTKNKRSTKNNNNTTILPIINDPSASFVGGYPTFYPNDDLQKNHECCTTTTTTTTTPNHKSLLSSASFTCDLCGESMYLLLQMYAPLDDLDRTMYVFGCNRASCFQRAFSLSNTTTTTTTTTNSSTTGVGTIVDSDFNKDRFCLGGKGVVKCYRSQQSQSRMDGSSKNNDKGVKNDSSIVDEDKKVNIYGVESKPAKLNDDWSGIKHENNDGSAWAGDDDSDDDSGGWGEIVDDDDNDNGGWGDDSNDTTKKAKDTEQVSMDDLEAMLSAMEAKEEEKQKEDDDDDDDETDEDKYYQKSSNSSSKKKSGNTPKETNIQKSTQRGMPQSNTNDNSNYTSSSSFQIHELEAYNEPMIKIRHNLQMEEDDDDMIGVSSNGNDESKVQRMLSSYLKEEEDENVKAVISNVHRGGSTSSSGGTGSQKGYDEKYERLSPEDRAFLSFTDRIKRAPYQVVRYAYDGVPMWSIPTPLTAAGKKGGRCRDTNFPTVPPCKCGAKRTFEFQLMPSMLHLLDVDSYTTNGKGTDIQQFMHKDSGGMNWGAIAVYSCPESCLFSAEEFVVIQESVDANPQKVQIQSIRNDQGHGDGD